MKSELVLHSDGTCSFTLTSANKAEKEMLEAIHLRKNTVKVDTRPIRDIAKGDTSQQIILTFSE